ncbi:MAG: GTP cyclohydrolase 1 [Isosphaeraceae bacterium]|jgi:GTP cyclohydrolase I|nr:MAG: GTP cyclohydrolase 1 [Isosphaeraceae bacterium]
MTNPDGPCLDFPPVSIADDGLATHIDRDRIRRAVREILIAIGEDPDREGLIDTPDRVARMYAELFSGLHADPGDHLSRTFTQETYDEMVVVRNIEFASMCEHHLLPFTGQAHIAYIPQGRVVGLSKIPRVVETLSRRPQLQERLTQQIAHMLMDRLDAKGVAVVLEASHSCMTIRGVRKPGSFFVTSAMLGLFRDRHATRAEFLALVRDGRTG